MKKFNDFIINENNKSLTMESLLAQREHLFANIEKWFLSEMEEWSQKHNAHLEHFGQLRMWEIGSDDSYEPYSHRPEKHLEERFEEALQEFEIIVDNLSELDFRYQAIVFSDRSKVIY